MDQQAQNEERGEQEKLRTFVELVQCCHRLYLSCCDGDLNVLSSDMPCQELSDLLFHTPRFRGNILKCAGRFREPVILANELQLMWAVDFRWVEGQRANIYLLGPFFIYDLPIRAVEAELSRQKIAGPRWQEVMDFLGQVPVISLSRILEYAVTMHYCITGEHISVGEVHFPEEEYCKKKTEAELSDAHGTYAVEQEMLQMVREGNLNYKSLMGKLSSTGRVGDISDGDPTRQLKNMIIVSITLYSRAAMEGGLAPEVAYALSDQYYQAVERSKTYAEVVDISYTMQEDFIQRVHQSRQNDQCSAAVRACIDQIYLHIEDEFTLRDIAANVGYSEYYLSKKFKKETGCTVQQFQKDARLERAKLLLETTQEPVHIIGERLCFGSHSFFTKTFRDRYGVTPSQYRDRLRTTKEDDHEKDA